MLVSAAHQFGDAALGAEHISRFPTGHKRTAVVRDDSKPDDTPQSDQTPQEILQQASRLRENPLQLGANSPASRSPNPCRVIGCPGNIQMRSTFKGPQ